MDVRVFRSAFADLLPDYSGNIGFRRDGRRRRRVLREKRRKKSAAGDTTATK